VDPRQYAEHHAIEATHWWFRGRRAVLRRAITDLAVRPNRVLDLGCGVGANLDLLAELFPDARRTAIDIEDAALRFCGLRHDDALCRADAATLPFDEGSFDLVVALDTLEHLPDDESAVAEFRRVCAPGGAVLLTVPAFPVLWGNIDELGHHYRRYRRAELVARIESSGLELAFARYFNFLLFPPIAAIRLLGRLWPARDRAAPKRSDFDVVREGLLNDLLARTFALEARLLHWGPPFGVSLVCAARRPV
jgi:SAM-dependent methyltransferase